MTCLTGGHSSFPVTLPSYRVSWFSFYFSFSSCCFVGSSSSAQPQTGLPRSLVIGTRLFLPSSHISRGLIHVHSSKRHTCADSFQARPSIPDLSCQLQDVCPPPASPFGCQRAYPVTTTKSQTPSSPSFVVSVHDTGIHPISHKCPPFYD